MNNTDTPVLRFTFGNFIKDARVKNGMSQLEVASLAGIDQAYLSKVERGTREPTLGVALRICDALKLDINDYAKQYI